MTHPYPPRPSTLHASLLAYPGTGYEPDAFQTTAGSWHGAVGYRAGALAFTIQGPPVALRELAAALHAAADQADEHTAADQAKQPAAEQPDEPATLPEPAAEGVTG